MSKFWNIRLSKLFPFILMSLIAGSSPVMADKDLKKGEKLKVLVKEMKKEVRALQEDAEKKIKYKRKLILNSLNDLLSKYQALDDKKNFNLLLIEVETLKQKMVNSSKDKLFHIEDEDLSDDSRSRYFEYQESYVFDEKRAISGELTFMPNNKVKALYKYDGKDRSEIWDWKDMGDHVQISAGGFMGTIIVSECPKSKLKSIFIRWGGKLKNRLTYGHTK